MDAEIYAVVVRRLVEADHGWGQPYDFQAIYVLDQAVPNVEEDPSGGIKDPEQGQPLDEALRSALQALLADLPTLTFVQSFYDVYDAARPGPNQIRDGGAYIALGPVYEDAKTAVVGAMFYGGRLWSRSIRYYLEQEEEVWRIASSKILAVS
ncbi:MAG TPA: hypothetical protein VFX24_10460 [Ktedonobacterales bacterium]|nr:hypothetical protein [Ktedonobacterales bacterium]